MSNVQGDSFSFGLDYWAKDARMSLVKSRH